jgi:Kef-type K+ transport system membrane component KefB
MPISMKNLRNIAFYAGVTLAAIALMCWTVRHGGGLGSGLNPAAAQSDPRQSDAWTDFLGSLAQNIQNPAALLLAQIIAIIVAARSCGWLFKRIGQPAVMGEIIAGIALGPSLLGLYFPGFFRSLFPAESLGNLKVLSQIGLIMFMFVVGMGIDLQVLRRKTLDALIISHVSVIFPFTLGMLLSLMLYHTFAPANVGFLSFSLFMGIAMSITAFPVLARILQERGIHETRLGTLAITCAAADDVTAWCILAAVIATVKAGSFHSALYMVALSIVYVLVMIAVVRPYLRKMAEPYAAGERLNKSMAVAAFLTLLASSWVAEAIGIHALFGAFMAGAIMPGRAGIKRLLADKVEDFSLVLLLPLFFVFTGLRTEINLLTDSYLWLITGLIIAFAVLGKFFGSTIAARFVGQSWQDSLSIGALMNTRGLMELVVLNIGYDLGVLSPKIFTMMVIMALATTAMTGPALNAIEHFSRTRGHDSAATLPPKT